MIEQRRGSSHMKDRRIRLTPLERAGSSFFGAFFRGLGYGVARAALKLVGLR